MSSCDACTSPGACCSGFVLNLPVFDEVTWREDAVAALARHGIDYMVPAGRFFSPSTGGMDTIRYHCTRIGTDGRCTDYENRPQLCHDYQAGQDMLCAMHEFKLKGIPIRVVAAAAAPA